MENIGDRINRLRETLGFSTVAEFSRVLGYKNPSTIATMITRGKEANPTYEALINILDRFPEVSPGWLLAGEGPMLRKGDISSVPGKRVLMICEIEGITKEQFAKRIGKSEQVINDIVADKVKLAHNIIYDILEEFPNVRPRWFVYGHEPILRNLEAHKLMVELSKEKIEVIVNVRPR